MIKKRLCLPVFLIFGLIAAQDTINLKVYHEKVDQHYALFVDNPEYAPVSVEYTYTSENMNSSLQNKGVMVIPAQSSRVLLTELSAINPKKGTKFNYDVYHVLGDTSIKDINEDYIYSLPFEKNKTHRIYQGYHGKFSHQKDLALDFSHKEGEKVLAARDGKVVQVNDDNNQHCATKDCAKYNNRIVILHNDGSFAEYVHLKHKGAMIKKGDIVKQGQPIAYSGNTGWSKGPHLHFAVYINNIDGSRKYIKTKFKTTASQPQYLQEQNSYSKNYN